MKKYLLLLLTFAITSGACNTSNAQTIELLAGNTLNGAMNGVILGGATMALQNNTDFDPVRVGLGAGTLYGIGMGIYDITQTDKGQQFYISGILNDGTNTSIIILLDTIYGAAGGAIIASSVSLIAKNPLGEAVQYGAGTGAWIGFGFGLVDAFVFAEGPNYSQSQASLPKSEVSGLFTYRNETRSVEIGMISPTVTELTKLSHQSLKKTYNPTVNILQMNIDL